MRFRYLVVSLFILILGNGPISFGQQTLSAHISKRFGLPVYAAHEIGDFIFFSTGKAGVFVTTHSSLNEDAEVPLEVQFLKRTDTSQRYRFSPWETILGLHMLIGDEAAEREIDKNREIDLPYVYRLASIDDHLLVGHEKGVDLVDISLFTQSLGTASQSLGRLHENNSHFPILLTLPLHDDDKEKLKDPSWGLLHWVDGHFEREKAILTTSFTPLLANQQFFMIQARGRGGMVVDQWTVGENQSLTQVLELYREGKLPTSKRTYLERSAELSDIFFRAVVKHTSRVGQLGPFSPAEDRSEDQSQRIPKHLNGIRSVTEFGGNLYFVTPTGIDQISVKNFIEYITDADNLGSSLMPTEHQSIPFPTGVTFLIGAFSNTLRLVSHWNASREESLISLYSEDLTLLNQWQFELSISNLAMGRLLPHQYKAELFAAAGDRGIHVFEIDLELATIHPNFIKRIDTLLPSELTENMVSMQRQSRLDPERITSTWVNDRYVYFTSLHAAFSSFHVIPAIDLLMLAQKRRHIKVNQALNQRFRLKQTAKGILQGIVASVPFDNDALVDIVPLDFLGDVDEQLLAFDVHDIISDEERLEFERMFALAKMSGELGGHLTQFGLIFWRVLKLRQLKRSVRATHVSNVSQLRQALGIEYAPLAASKHWLTGWKATEELALSAETLSHYRLKAEHLARGAYGDVFSLKELQNIISLMEKHRSHIRPLERILTKAFGYTDQIGVLQKWRFSAFSIGKWKIFKSLSKFFSRVPDEELALLFNETFLNHWTRLQRLHKMEELSEFHKMEQMYLTTTIKAGIIKAIQQANELGVSKETLRMLKGMSRKIGSPNAASLEKMYLETAALAEKFSRSEEAYRLRRVVDLAQKAKLTDLEKLEQLQLLVKTGWSKKAADAMQYATQAAESWKPLYLDAKMTDRLNKLDKVFDFEQMQRSNYLRQTFRRGKFLEMLLYTAYGDGINVATEYYNRRQEGRPFLSKGLFHNLVYNTYIMLPIFATQGLRMGWQGKAFILGLNATSTGFMTQKITKYGHTLMDSQQVLYRVNRDWDKLSMSEKSFFWLPPPKMPIGEIPGYIWRDMMWQYQAGREPSPIFFTPDPEFNAGWALLDDGWTAFLSTPRGILASQQAGYLANLPIWDGAGPLKLVLREGARVMPIVANETVGAVAYPPIYGRFFEDRQLQLNVLDANLTLIDPWQTDKWTDSPKLKLTMSIFSSTKPKELRFGLKSIGTISGETKLQYITIPSDSWKETYEQYYELTWEQDVRYDPENVLYIIDDVVLENSARNVGDNLNPWGEEVAEKGIRLRNPIAPLATISSQQMPFAQGLLQALVAISKEASHFHHLEKKHLSAGLVYMISQYLEPFYYELTLPQESHNIAIDALKESVRLSGFVNFSDDPVNPEVIDQITGFLEVLAHRAIPEGKLQLNPLFDQPDAPMINPYRGESCKQYFNSRHWIDCHTQKILDAIREDILMETRSYYWLWDQGSKGDWQTLQIYKGYAYGLSKLYRWYKHHYKEEIGTRHASLDDIIHVLEEMESFGNELEESWVAGIYWSDQYLVDFADLILMLKETLREVN